MMDDFQRLWAYVDPFELGSNGKNAVSDARKHLNYMIEWNRMIGNTSTEYAYTAVHVSKSWLTISSMIAANKFLNGATKRWAHQSERLEELSPERRAVDALLWSPAAGAAGDWTEIYSYSPAIVVAKHIWKGKQTVHCTDTVSYLSK